MYVLATAGMPYELVKYDDDTVNWGDKINGSWTGNTSNYKTYKYNSQVYLVIYSQKKST
jgi:hypothetical protein